MDEVAKMFMKHLWALAPLKIYFMHLGNSLMSASPSFLTEVILEFPSIQNLSSPARKSLPWVFISLSQSPLDLWKVRREMEEVVRWIKENWMQFIKSRYLDWFYCTENLRRHSLSLIIINYQTPFHWLSVDYMTCLSDRVTLICSANKMRLYEMTQI